MTKAILEKALNEIMNEYDAFLINNKYGKEEDNTHKEQFEILSQLKGERVEQALGWIKNCYDCYYKKDYENDEESAFAYLKDRIAEYE